MSHQDFYQTDPNDPEAPVLLSEYRGLRPGMRVRYTGPPGLPDIHTTLLTLTALYQFPYLSADEPEYVTAILNGGEYEVDGDNLVADPGTVPDSES